MRRRLRFLAGASGSCLVSFALLLACSDAAKEPSRLPTEDDDARPARADAGNGGNSETGPGVDAGPRTGRVYAHTQDTLYLFEPFSRELTRVGPFSCLEAGEPMIDIAVDRTGAMYGTSFDRFFSIDPVTASCTLVANATGVEDYPNALSFVPAGTVDQTKEALVGYSTQIGNNVADRYVRIDVQTGAMTVIGNMNAAAAPIKYRASGDIISLIQDGNRTYVTVKAQNDAGPATDQVAEVDPVSGAVKRIVGDTKTNDIFGFGYWAGKGYAFSADGRVSELDMQNGSATVLETLTGDGGAPVPWYGAGVTTQAPVAP